MEVSVRRRISIAVAAIGASALLAVSGGMALAKSKASAGSTLKCSLSLATETPAGSANVPQPAASGSQYGPVRCAKAGFGGGLAGDHFTVPDSGDLVGPYTEYFPTGTIHGKLDLVPSNSGLTSTSFTSVTYSGTVTVTGGTGTLRGTKSTKAGTIKCTSPDTVHLTCHEQVKLK
jgi:hypothetical protein